MKQIKSILLAGVLLFCMVPATAQLKKRLIKPKPLLKEEPYISQQLISFQHSAAQANVSFIFPPGYREIKAPDNEDFSFDYGMELPGKDFEVWFLIRSQKENWISYQKNAGNKNTRLANPDSLYLGLGTAHAISLTGDRNVNARSIPERIVARYNADAGKSYLLNLLDMPVTRHYKYALLITLQKNHTGTILAVCFTNDKGPEFYKNMDRASNCVKFKPGT